MNVCWWLIAPILAKAGLAIIEIDGGKQLLVIERTVSHLIPLAYSPL